MYTAEQARKETKEHYNIDIVIERIKKAVPNGDSTNAYMPKEVAQELIERGFNITPIKDEEKTLVHYLIEW